jgi:hypothetical protein
MLGVKNRRWEIDPAFLVKKERSPDFWSGLF